MKAEEKCFCPVCEYEDKVKLNKCSNNEQELYEWILLQKKRYRGEGKPLTRHEVRMLENLPGWKWEIET